MNKVFGVAVPNGDGGTNFYAVVAVDHDEAAGIVNERTDVPESEMTVEPLDIMLNEQYDGYAVLSTEDCF